MPAVGTMVRLTCTAVVAMEMMFAQLVSSQCATNFTSSAVQSIHRLNDVLAKYDKKTRPQFGGDAVNVSVQIGVVAFGPINEKTSTFDLDIYLRQTWTDERLCFDGDQSVTMNEDPNHLIWVPDTSFPNAIDSKKHHVTTINSRIRLSPNGLIFTSQRVSLKCTCHLNLENFPMDTQICSLEIESYAFTSKEIKYMWVQEVAPVEMAAKNLQLEGFIIKNISTTTKYILYNTGAVPEGFTWLVMSFTISRNFNYYLFHYYCPSILLVSMTWATFWFPSTAFPARVTLIVTTLLSCIFIVQNSIAQLVRTSYRTSLEVFLSINVFYIVMCIVEYLLVINLPPRPAHPRGIRLLRMLQRNETRCSNGTVAVECSNTSHATSLGQREASPPPEKAEMDPVAYDETEAGCAVRSLNSNCHFVDSWARIVFPLSYTVFVIVYFAYYTSQNDN